MKYLSFITTLNKKLVFGLTVLAVAVSGSLSVMGPGVQTANAATCRSYIYGYGGNGTCVKHVQTLLRGWHYSASQGYYTRYLTADGDFGPNTLAAVKKFQGAFGLKQDGIVGRYTWNKLCNPGFGGNGYDSWTKNWNASRRAACQIFKTPSEDRRCFYMENKKINKVFTDWFIMK